MRAQSRNASKKIVDGKKAGLSPKPTVRNKARITISQKTPVNGIATVKKVSRGPRRGHRSSKVTTTQWPANLLADAKARLRVNEKLVIVSDKEAKTVYL